MKQRVTYLLPQGTALERDDISVKSNSLEFSKGAQAAQEWRLTLDLNDLPEEIRLIVQDCRELHLKWVSPTHNDRVSPLVARTPPGFHAFFVPRAGNLDVRLCDLFEHLLQSPDGKRAKLDKCISVAESFIHPKPIAAPTHTSNTLQFFTLPKSPVDFGTVFLGSICHPDSFRDSVRAVALDACDAQIDELAAADHIDFDYDGESGAATITAYWDTVQRTGSTLAKERAERSVRKTRADDRVEVGVLQIEPEEKPGEMKLGGFLTVLGDEDRPSGTLFSFPSRHHALPSSNRATFNVSLQQPTGLHPKLDITMSWKSLIPPSDICFLHAYLTLPSEVFLDRYQLSDKPFLHSQKLLDMHMLSGEDDLEAPDWVIRRWGSAALFQLGVPSGFPAEEDWTMTMPMHLRYLNGSSHSTKRPDQATIEIPWPVVFWSCPIASDNPKSTNPFDRIYLGYDALFEPDTVFYHVPPVEGAVTVEKIQVPTLDVQGAQWVPMGTLAVVTLGFAWICWQLIRTASKASISTSTSTKAKTKAKGVKK